MQVYGFTSPEEVMQVVTLRIEATGRVPRADIARHPPAESDVADSIMAHRQVWLPETGDFVSCPVHDRTRLGPGHVVTGPAIVEQMDSTTLILAGQTASVDPWLNLIIEDVA